jgi:ketosteroid isomerase-like protein
MKKSLMIISLVFLLCFNFSCQQGEEVAEEPAVDVEAEKEAVAECFHAYIDTAVEGDIEKLKSFYHPEMSWWDYKQEHPVGIEAYLKSMEDYYKSGLKWICDLGPFEIHIVGDTAVLYTTYKNKFTDPEGNETTSSGPWTAVLIKQDGKWLFLSNSFT